LRSVLHALPLTSRFSLIFKAILRYRSIAHGLTGSKKEY
jgi:hypothetical protein